VFPEVRSRFDAIPFVPGHDCKRMYKCASASRKENAGSKAATPQFSGHVATRPARRTCTMKWRTCAALATPFQGPLQLLVLRWHAAQRNHFQMSQCASLRQFTFDHADKAM
jgi:hypothetical protein